MLWSDSQVSSQICDCKLWFKLHLQLKIILTRFQIKGASFWWYTRKQYSQNRLVLDNGAITRPSFVRFQQFSTNWLLSHLRREKFIAAKKPKLQCFWKYLWVLFEIWPILVHNGLLEIVFDPKTLLITRFIRGF